MVKQKENLENIKRQTTNQFKRFDVQLMSAGKGKQKELKENINEKNENLLE